MRTNCRIELAGGTLALTQGAHGVYLGTPAQWLPPLTVVVEGAVTVTSLHAGGG